MRFSADGRGVRRLPAPTVVRMREAGVAESMKVVDGARRRPAQQRPRIGPRVGSVVQLRDPSKGEVGFEPCERIADRVVLALYRRRRQQAQRIEYDLAPVAVGVRDEPRLEDPVVVTDHRRVDGTVRPARADSNPVADRIDRLDRQQIVAVVGDAHARAERVLVAARHEEVLAGARALVLHRRRRVARVERPARRNPEPTIAIQIDVAAAVGPARREHGRRQWQQRFRRRRSRRTNQIQGPAETRRTEGSA